MAETVADSEMAWLERTTFPNIFLYGWFYIMLQCMFSMQLLKLLSNSILYCAWVNVLQLSECQFHKLTLSATVRIFFFFCMHAALTSYLTSGHTHHCDWAQSETSDEPAQILGTPQLQHGRANSVQSFFGHPLWKFQFVCCLSLVFNYVSNVEMVSFHILLLMTFYMIRAYSKKSGPNWILKLGEYSLRRTTTYGILFTSITMLSSFISQKLSQEAEAVCEKLTMLLLLPRE